MTAIMRSMLLDKQEELTGGGRKGFERRHPLRIEWKKAAWEYSELNVASCR
jgi:hypothetical protein